MSAADASSNPAMAVWKGAKPFVNGGLAGMGATCVIQPIDIVKVRLQLGASGGPFHVAADIVKKEGFSTLYRGLSAGLLRQATYTTARLGLFKVFTTKATEMNEGKPLPLYQKALCGLAAGGLGALTGSPADLSLIRMQADGTLPIEQRRNYANVFAAMSTIVKEEGVSGLFVGASTTAIRAMALNMGMLASNEQAKELIIAAGYPGAPAIFGASAIAGFFASAFSLPFDYVKTQLQKMKAGPDGKFPYSGTLDCFIKTVQEGGPLKLYTGFPTYFVRIAPHATITLVMLNYISEFEKKVGL